MRRLGLLFLLVVGCRCDGKAKDGGELYCGTDASSKRLAEKLLKYCEAQIRRDAANECCRRHDMCYGQCAGKEHCDNEFRTCLEAVVDGANEDCGKVPSTMYNAVHYLGSEAYKASCS